MASITNTPGGSGPVYGDDEMAQERAGGVVPLSPKGRGAIASAEPAGAKGAKPKAGALLQEPESASSGRIHRSHLSTSTVGSNVKGRN